MPEQKWLRKTLTKQRKKRSKAKRSITKALVISSSRFGGQIATPMARKAAQIKLAQFSVTTRSPSGQ